MGVATAMLPFVGGTGTGQMGVVTLPFVGGTGTGQMGVATAMLPFVGGTGTGQMGVVTLPFLGGREGVRPAVSPFVEAGETAQIRLVPLS
jgi:hypothetical protein